MEMGCFGRLWHTFVQQQELFCAMAQQVVVYQNVPLITESDEYKEGGALFIIWDEAEDSGKFSDGPIGMFILSPFAKGGGKKAFGNSIHYDHSSTLKTLQEIFRVEPPLGAAATPRQRILATSLRAIAETVLTTTKTAGIE
jgi:hypothetical protein